MKAIVNQVPQTSGMHIRTKQIPRYLLKFREQIYKQLWDEYKSELSMSDLATILRISLSQFYKILKENLKNKTKKDGK